MSDDRITQKYGAKDCRTCKDSPYFEGKGFHCPECDRCGRRKKCSICLDVAKGSVPPSHQDGHRERTQVVVGP